MISFRYKEKSTNPELRMRKKKQLLRRRIRQVDGRSVRMTIEGKKNLGGGGSV